MLNFAGIIAIWGTAGNRHLRFSRKCQCLSKEGQLPSRCAGISNRYGAESDTSVPQTNLSHCGVMQFLKSIAHDSRLYLTGYDIILAISWRSIRFLREGGQVSKPSSQRLPDWGKLFVAVVEGWAQSVVGAEAIKEMKAPLRKKQLQKHLLAATVRAEARLIAEYPEKEITAALSQLPIADLPSVKTAVGIFCENPTDPRMLDELTTQISRIVGRGRRDKVASAAGDYMKYLWEEMASVPEVQDKLVAVATIRAQRDLAESAKHRRSSDETKRLEEVLKACLELNEVLGAWYTAIADAVRSEDTPDKTFRKLEIFWHETSHFEPRFQSAYHKIGDEPLCKDLRAKAVIFGKAAFAGKGTTEGWLRLYLKKSSPAIFARDYERHKDEALSYVRKQHTEFQTELNHVMARLGERITESRSA